MPAWFQTASSPLDALGSTIGRSPDGSVLPSVRSQYEADIAASLAPYFNEERRRWDANYQQKQTELDRNYDLAKRSARTQEQSLALDEWYKKESASLARDRLAQDKYEFDATNSLSQAKLGYDLLGMGANLRGPRNTLQYQRLAEGMAANPQTATLFSNLDQQTAGAGFQQFGPGQLEPMTLRSMYEDLTGTGSNSAASPSNVADMERERQEVVKYAQNPHLMAAGTWERWSPDKRDLFASLAEGSGASIPTFLSGYGNSRIGQGIAGTRAA